MSTLWTPSGEHPVERNQPDATPEPAPAPDEEPLTPEEQAAAEEYAQQIDAMRRQLLELPAGVVVGQHALQFFDVAGLYLSQSPPRIEDARLAIDALAAVVERLGSRLGDAETPIRQALNQAQLAFVDAARSAGAAAPDA
ncbi:MAG TPA: hypothetical protein VFB94_26405 [Acidimicrobiales bacterium]|nr:hypothetical protein [Acidimicrobiales bacterium]